MERARARDGTDAGRQSGAFLCRLQPRPAALRGALPGPAHRDRGSAEQLPALSRFGRPEFPAAPPCRTGSVATAGRAGAGAVQPNFRSASRDRAAEAAPIKPGLVFLPDSKNPAEKRAYFLTLEVSLLALACASCARPCSPCAW